MDFVVETDSADDDDDDVMAVRSNPPTSFIAVRRFNSFFILSKKTSYIKHSKNSIR